MILAQDGYGPREKIGEGITAGYLDGAVLSIKYRNPDALPHTITSMLTRYPDADLFLDTHFYASQMTMTSAGKIPDYQLYETGLTRTDFSVKNINNYARRLIDYQRGLGLTNIIIPSLTVANFDAYSSYLSLQLYEASLDYLREIGMTTQLKAYLSLVFHESALLDDEKLSQYLDDVTLLQDVAGFYVVVERNNGGFPQWQDSRTLSKLMYVVNTLSDNYDVVCGFTDFPGLLLLGAGAKHVASGWHQTLRQYTGSYFMTTGGSNNGTFRYASKELLAQLLSVPDLQSIIRRGLGSQYVDPTYGGGLTDPDNLLFPQPGRVLHQWKAFHDLGGQITAATDPMAEIERLIDVAEAVILLLLLKPGLISMPHQLVTMLDGGKRSILSEVVYYNARAKHAKNKKRRTIRKSFRIEQVLIRHLLL